MRLGVGGHTQYGWSTVQPTMPSLLQRVPSGQTLVFGLLGSQWTPGAPRAGTETRRATPRDSTVAVEIFMLLSLKSCVCLVCSGWFLFLVLLCFVFVFVLFVNTQSLPIVDIFCGFAQFSRCRDLMIRGIHGGCF